MKKSEILKKKLEEVKVQREKAKKEMVFDRLNETGKNHEELFKEYWKTCGRDSHMKEEELETEIRTELNREIEVGDGVTINLYSDRNACTVIKRTAKTLTVQRDKATLDPNFKPEIIAGGFAGHCTNQDGQTYTYERNENGTKTVFHWSEKKGRWQTGSDGSITLSRGRHEFYDYNF